VAVAARTTIRVRAVARHFMTVLLVLLALESIEVLELLLAWTAKVNKLLARMVRFGVISEFRELDPHFRS
jgi:hypothetical protein